MTTCDVCPNEATNADVHIVEITREGADLYKTWTVIQLPRCDQHPGQRRYHLRDHRVMTAAEYDAQFEGYAVS
jgi:hypothetical protein